MFSHLEQCNHNPTHAQSQFVHTQIMQRADLENVLNFIESAVAVMEDFLRLLIIIDTVLDDLLL